MDMQLSRNAYIAGAEYTIADIAIWPWLRSHKNQGIDLDEFKSVKRWFDEIAERPAVQRGIEVLANLRRPLVDDKARDNLFGQTQYQRR
jgi:GST-like protein